MDPISLSHDSAQSEVASARRRHSRHHIKGDPRCWRPAPGEADVLIGGPPCQPFSKSSYWVSGDARRLDDPRADTLTAYLRVLRDTQPRMFLLENVPGLAYKGKDEGMKHLAARD